MVGGGLPGRVGPTIGDVGVGPHVIDCPFWTIRGGLFVRWACGVAAAGVRRWIRQRGGVGSAEAESFDGGPGAEEPVEAGGVADQPHGDGAGPAQEHGGGGGGGGGERGG